MAGQHTPGRWAATNGKYGWQIHCVPSEKNKSSHWIANIKCESCPAHEEANARLIAAAPDLLDALEVALDFVEVIEGRSSAQTPLADRIRAAISKARGQV